MHQNSPNNNFAFTLAEVLITLGIIGVVAAMTIPILMKNYQNAQYYSAFQKGYAALSQTILSLISENNDILGAISEYGSLEVAVASKIKTIQKCPVGTMNGDCMPSNSLTKNIDNISQAQNFVNYNRYVLSDGSALAIATQSSNCSLPVGSLTNVCGSIIIDTNSLKAPNTKGRDLFYFVVTPEKLIPWGSPNTGLFEWLDWYCNPKISDPNGGISCATKLLQEGKMNY